MYIDVCGDLLNNFKKISNVRNKNWELVIWFRKTTNIQMDTCLLAWGISWNFYDRANWQICRFWRSDIPFFDRFLWCICSTCLWSPKPFFSTTKPYWRALCISIRRSIHLLISRRSIHFCLSVGCFVGNYCHAIDWHRSPTWWSHCLNCGYRGSSVQELGYWYVLCPVGLGACIMLVVAILVNNLSGDQARKYPSSD